MKASIIAIYIIVVKNIAKYKVNANPATRGKNRFKKDVGRGLHHLYEQLNYHKKFGFFMLLSVFLWHILKISNEF